MVASRVSSMIDRRKFLQSIALTSAASACSPSREEGESDPYARDLEQAAVYTAGLDGYHTYRIPSQIVTPKGTLLAFCEGCKDDRRDHGDIDLLVKRSEDGGRVWFGQTIVHEEGGAEKVTIGNPCPVVDKDTGIIWMPFCRDNDAVFMTKSEDDGLTWAAPVEITSSVKDPSWSWYATGPGAGIQLTRGPHAGRLVIPNDHRGPLGDGDAKYSHAFFSDDHGATWKLGGTVAPHTDECQVVELAEGALMMNMRNYWERDGGDTSKGGKRAIATSADGGETWSELSFDETLIEPVCQASFLRYSWPDGAVKSRLLFSNPASTEARVKMTVRLSYDEGKTWPIAKLLHEGPAAYSCLAVLPDQRIGCLYERGAEHSYESISFARFTLRWLSGGADSAGT